MKALQNPGKSHDRERVKVREKRMSENRISVKDNSPPDIEIQ